MDISAKSKNKTGSIPVRATKAALVTLESRSEISLKDWFAFTLPYKEINTEPHHDFYFDFENTDAYNLQLNFSKPTEILNTVDLTKSLTNETFDFTSSINMLSETSYLLKVELKIKNRKLKKENAKDLTELAKAIADINSFVLKIKN